MDLVDFKPMIVCFFALQSNECRKTASWKFRIVSFANLNHHSLHFWCGTCVSCQKLKWLPNVYSSVLISLSKIQPLINSQRDRLNIQLEPEMTTLSKTNLSSLPRFCLSEVCFQGHLERRPVENVTISVHGCTHRQLWRIWHSIEIIRKS